MSFLLLLSCLLLSCNAQDYYKVHQSIELPPDQIGKFSVNEKTGDISFNIDSGNASLMLYANGTLDSIQLEINVLSVDVCNAYVYANSSLLFSIDTNKINNLGAPASEWIEYSTTLKLTANKVQIGGSSRTYHNNDSIQAFFDNLSDSSIEKPATFNLTHVSGTCVANFTLRSGNEHIKLFLLAKQFDAPNKMDFSKIQPPGEIDKALLIGSIAGGIGMTLLILVLMTVYLVYHYKKITQGL